MATGSALHIIRSALLPFGTKRSVHFYRKSTGQVVMNSSQLLPRHPPDFQDLFLAKPGATFVSQ
jgi:hypothetical protein